MGSKEELSEISVKYAAEILNISERAVVYKIQEGKYKGEKKEEEPGGKKKWMILFPEALIRAYEKKNEAEKPPEEFKRTSEKRAALPEARGRSSGTYKRTYDSKSDSQQSNENQEGGKKKYKDFRDLRAYGELLKLFNELQKEKSFDDNMRTLFLLALEKLAMGFYEFDRTKKAQIYSEARGTLARILNRLVAIAPLEKNLSQKIFNRIDGEVIGSVIAIIRAADGSKKKGNWRNDRNDRDDE